jgi:hypothetical protein
LRALSEQIIIIIIIIIISTEGHVYKPAGQSVKQLMSVRRIIFALFATAAVAVPSSGLAWCESLPSTVAGGCAAALWDSRKPDQCVLRRKECAGRACSGGECVPTEEYTDKILEKTYFETVDAHFWIFTPSICVGKDGAPDVECSKAYFYIRANAYFENEKLQACSDNTDCGRYFKCDSNARKCVHKTCTVTSECENGYQCDSESHICAPSARLSDYDWFVSLIPPPDACLVVSWDPKSPADCVFRRTCPEGTACGAGGTCIHRGDVFAWAAGGKINLVPVVDSCYENGALNIRCCQHLVYLFP